MPARRLRCRGHRKTPHLLRCHLFSWRITIDLTRGLSARALAAAHNRPHFILADLFGGLLEQHGRQLHRFDAHTLMFTNAGRNRFQPLEGSRAQRKEPSLRPPRDPLAVRHRPARETGVRCPTATALPRNSRRSRRPSLCARRQVPPRSVHVRVRLHPSTPLQSHGRREIRPDHQADFALARIASHRPAEACELSELSRILNADGSRVTVDLELTPEQQQTRPLLEEHNIMGFRRCSKESPTSRQRLSPEIHAIS